MPITDPTAFDVVRFRVPPMCLAGKQLLDAVNAYVCHRARIPSGALGTDPAAVITSETVVTTTAPVTLADITALDSFASTVQGLAAANGGALASLLAAFSVPR